MTIRPDGKLYVQSGVGNLGTHSMTDLARVAAEVLAMPWEKVAVIWGDTSKALPWTCLSVGSQTDTRDEQGELRGRDGCQTEAAGNSRALISAAGRPEDYDLGGERVYRRGSPAIGITYAQAATRAIELGGRYDGHVVPDAVHAMTKASAARLNADSGIDGRRQGQLPAGRQHVFLCHRLRYEVEVDVETGEGDAHRLASRASARMSAR